ncbi:GlxA family transcriptional regulator [Streptomyces sp. NPDC059629]|uniref:GlxA family transcriptional regulator n=1 Tax=Streptomyces sp. NPDC059629 TaxID=3346889 RepID=UPI00368DEE2D
MAICTGSSVLSAAGVLAGRRATTHWKHARLLQRVHPDVQVRDDELFVEDRGVYTSAGASAGIDLALALLEQDHGPDLARHLSRLFASELNTTPAKYVERVRLDHAKTLLDRGCKIAQAAQAAGFGSAETLRRLFVARVGTSPSQYRSRFEIPLRTRTHSSARRLRSCCDPGSLPAGAGMSRCVGLLSGSPLGGHPLTYENGISPFP